MRKRLFQLSSLSRLLFVVGLIVIVVSLIHGSVRSNNPNNALPNDSRVSEKSTLYFVSLPKALSGQPNASVAAGVVLQHLPVDKQSRDETASQAYETVALPPSNYDCQLAGLHASPDGRRVMADTRCRDHIGQTKLIDISTGEVRNAEPLPQQESIFLGWTPDGKSAILRVEPLVKNDILLVNMDNGETERIDVPRFTYDLAVASASERILYTVHQGMGLGGELWLMNRNGSNKQLLVNDPIHVITYPRWSPQGDAIAYIRMQDTNIPFTVGELWLTDGNGQNRRMVANADAGHGYPPVWSPDGKQIAFVMRENPNSVRADNLALELESNIYLVDVSTGHIRPLTQFKKTLADNISWSPDGQQLAFHTKVGNASSIWVADVQSGDLKQMTQDANASYPVWINDGGVSR